MKNKVIFNKTAIILSITMYIITTTCSLALIQPLPPTKKSSNKSLDDFAPDKANYLLYLNP